MQSKSRISIDELFRQLNVSHDGLSDSEAQSRLKKYGPNEIAEKKESLFIKFLKYFWGPIPWMIEAAVILSAVVADWTDFGIILLLLLTNAVVGFIEEYQADNAVAALKKSLAVKARALRNGNWSTMDASGLVPGDIIRLRLGDIVPADAVLMDEVKMQADQSALTGESLPVDKFQGDLLYSGSVIRQGEASAVVKATGASTFFGKTTSLVEEAGSTSHFQKAVLKIGNYLIIIALILVAAILAVSLYRGDEFLTILRFCLVLTIAAIPVAMPTVLSVTMVVGAKILSKKKAVVRKLSSIEELAGIDVLCSDKTGTLTKNKLEVGEVITFNGYSGDEVLEYAQLASRKENDDPIDSAVFKAGGGQSDDTRFKMVHFKPFDPVIKRTEAEVKDADGNKLLVSKGAPQVILNLCHPEQQQAEKIKTEIDDLAGRGYRSLGVAISKKENDWEYLGLLPLLDPPRNDSKAVIANAREMGIDVKMVTGDQEAIARETSAQLGIGRNILNASLFEDTKHHESGQMEDRIEEANGFAEVYPEHKYHIVDVLQKKKHIVGMTGDGVNDAPALKKADAGIAVSGATDAARAASAIVLLTPGLSVIIDAIKESRKIFQRMNSYTIYRITETIRVLLFMTLSILTFNFYPVTAVMIVLLALLNDGAIISIAYDRTLGSKHPEAWDMPLVFTLATVLGVIGVVESFGLLYVGKQYLGLSRELLQTLIYLKLSVAGHLTIFVTRTRKNFWTERPSMTLLLAVIVTQLIATLISVYGVFMTPIGWKMAGIVWLYCLVWFLIEDGAKEMIYKMLKNETLPGKKLQSVNQ
ncbi:MAG: plasma-membrane proton-efflux P-type ATPase [Bacteroidetes bacterium]|nr:plasma-membrane proton-efflux P-type ATPase [Bacteroidota bacterium]